MNNKLVQSTVFLTLLFIFWGWFFSKTIYGNPLYVYVSFLSLFILYSICLLNSNSRSYSKTVTVWIPFIFWMIGAWLISGSFEHCIYWFICLVLLLIARRNVIFENIHYKLLFGFGIIALLGIIVQIFLPSFYNSNFSNIWVHDNVDMWLNTGYGFNGFTYQLDTTAFLLIYAEGVCIFCFERTGLKKRYLQILFAILFIVGVGLTGKRSLLLISCVSPLIVLYLRSGNATGRIKSLLFASFIFIALYYFLMSNLDAIGELPGIGRMVSLMDAASSVDDVSSGRSELWAIAIKLFKDNPIFGIGAGRYVSLSGAGTNAHNTYLEILCELGVVGFTLFLIPLIYTLIKTIKDIRKTSGNKREEMSLLLFTELFFIIYSITGNTFVNLPCYMMYFVVLANGMTSKTSTINEYSQTHI